MLQFLLNSLLSPVLQVGLLCLLFLLLLILGELLLRRSVKPGRKSLLRVVPKALWHLARLSDTAARWLDKRLPDRGVSDIF